LLRSASGQFIEPQTLVFESSDHHAEAVIVANEVLFGGAIIETEILLIEVNGTGEKVRR